VRLAARRAGVDHGTAYGIRARGQAVEDMPIEAVRDEVLRRIAAIRAHRERRGEGE
jgi:4-hydroxy-L-threonine phosphate dehydrogenase PdxA